MLKRNWRTLIAFVTLLVDAFAILFCGLTATFTRSHLSSLPHIDPATFTMIAIVSAVVFLSAGSILGLYRSTYRSTLTTQYRDAGKTYVYTVLATLVYFFLIIKAPVPPRFTLLFFLFLPFFLAFGRWFLNHVHKGFETMGYGIINSLILCPEADALPILRRFETSPELGYRVKGIVLPKSSASNGSTANGPQEELQTTPESVSIARYDFVELQKAVETHHIETIFVPLLKPQSNGQHEVLDLCKSKRIKLRLVSKESEDLLRFSYVKDLVGISLHLPIRPRITRAKAILKRGFDVLGSLLLLIAFSPLFFIVALAIPLEDGRPIFFRQKRSLVQGGKVFDCFKFRSMGKDAEKHQDKLYGFNQTSGGLFLMDDDPRITNVGRWIRRFSIDELPQLLNVLRGEMSLVGPRPLSLADLDKVTSENGLEGYYRHRAQAKPGMTGLWQICGRRQVPFREMILLDLYYFENQSIMFDLEILFATFPVVLFGKGAY